MRVESFMQLRFSLCIVPLIAALAASAAAYPVRPIKVYHGFAAGGPPDIAVRRIATALEKRLGQPVVVENRPGASGTIAASLVARADPDGYTLLFGVAANLAVAPAAMVDPPYDPTTAFTPIVEVARGPYLWLVPAGSDARTMRQFIAQARAAPGKLNVGTPGIASVHHFATETMAHSVGIVITHVPYATGGLYQGILSGQVDAMFESMPGPMPYINAGQLRALAVTGDKRLPLLPDVPTLREEGVPDPGANSWWGFVGPRGLSPDVVQMLNREISAVLHEGELVASFSAMAIECSPGTPEQFRSYIDAQYAHWREQSRRLGIHLK